MNNTQGIWKLPSIKPISGVKVIIATPSAIVGIAIGWWHSVKECWFISGKDSPVTVDFWTERPRPAGPDHDPSNPRDARDMLSVANPESSEHYL